MSNTLSPLRVTVIGGGSWGTTLANHLANIGHHVGLWVHEPELAVSITQNRQNPLFLPGIQLHRSIAASSSLAEALSGAEVVLYVTPSHVAREVLRLSIRYFPRDIPVVVGTKGIEAETLKTMSEVFEEELPTETPRRQAFLSGPSFAREVVLGLPTAVSVASRDPDTAAFFQNLLSTASFRVYTNPDVTGVELGGALKNVMAIAAGISDGLELGHNARSALITRGLAEMTRLGVALGAHERTFAGLSGMGDLVLTCTGDLSRNRSLGLLLGQGRKLPEILAEMLMVAEGVKTTLAAVRLARKLGVELPIAEQTFKILYEDKDPRSALQELMGRDLRSEGV